MLSNVSVGQSEDWDDHLDRMLLAYRPSVHHTTGATPGRIMFGKKLSCRTRTERTTALIQTRKWKKNKATVRGCILEGKRKITVVRWLLSSRKIQTSENYILTLYADNTYRSIITVMYCFVVLLFTNVMHTLQIQELIGLQDSLVRGSQCYAHKFEAFNFGKGRNPHCRFRLESFQRADWKRFVNGENNLYKNTKIIIKLLQ
ncbi:conserved hypothetical protein, partial [Trichinella spiralis]|uniref:hypothetical protein n=1 Tax=Trichinella spiralis TaxID=6334 RepID=UPI0001EFC6D9